MEIEYDIELSERKKMILKAIVEAHIKLGEPVGSKYLTQEMGISYSSATIRNEMSELEEMGFLEQPHTSAGRIPSELGYRFYVDSLVQQYDMTAKEANELNNMLSVKMSEIDKILENARKAASAMTNYTAMTLRASTYRPPSFSYKPSTPRGRAQAPKYLRQTIRKRLLSDRKDGAFFLSRKGC